MTTGNMITIARPYALAAFETALAKHALQEWNSMLQAATELTQQALIQRLLDTPNVTADQLAAVFCDALAPVLDVEKKNFIKLLAENKRLLALPEILQAFQALRAEHDKTVNVEVTSAIELNEAYQQKLIAALTNRLQRKVTLHCQVDPSLIAGITVHAGDLVLDGSVRGKLDRLIEFI